MIRTRILHLDADAFAAAVHRLEEPPLVGAPLLIGDEAEGRGTVHCVAYEARRPGIRPGMPMAHVHRLLPDAVIRPPRLLQYEAASRRIFELLCQRAPVVEQASLDDFYLDLTGCERWCGGDLSAWATRLLRDLAKATGIPFSGGLASDKITARTATRVAKPQGLLTVAPGQEAAFLASLQLEVLPELPRELLAKLREFGVHRLADLDHLGQERLELFFGARGRWLWAAAHGQWRPAVVASRLDRQIQREYRFEPDTTHPDRLEAALLLLTEQLTHDLRRENLRSRRMFLTLLYSDERTERRIATLSYGSNQTLDWWPPLRRALNSMAKRRVRVRGLHLCATVENGEAVALDFLEERRLERRRALYHAVDRVRARHGFGALLPPRALCAFTRSTFAGGHNS
ncbi:MAG: DNA polymerase IV [Candidatus Sumerlaea sp.]|nr:DNA polymerase IV [Candidatus Sumerlaea chitinivorans]GIX44945.1 MAG: DNA polymerase IV [Candidatus Sumerlaea sp.]